MSERLHRNWVRLYLEGSNSEALVNLGAKVRRQYLDALSMLRLSLTRRAAQYDVYSMAAGTVLVLEVRVPGQGRCVAGGQLRQRLVVKGRGDSVFLEGTGARPVGTVVDTRCSRSRPSPCSCSASRRR